MRYVSMLLSLVLLLAMAPTAEAQDPPWRLTNVAPEGVLAGYSVGESIVPGDPLQLKIKAEGQQVEIQVFRIGHYDGVGARLVDRASGVQVSPQPECSTVNRTVDCSAWSVTHTFDTTGWEPGVYLSKLIDDKGRQHYVGTVVRSTQHAGTLAIMSATFTHAAYNSSGGYSLYQGIGPTADKVAHRAYTVSLNRPSRANGADKIYRYEIGLIQHLESLGLPLSYTSNGELDRSARPLQGAAALVMLGHDEYWTVAMRDNATTLRDQGTNLLFLGSNAVYYRTRWDEATQGVTSYKLSELDPVQTREATGTFRSEPYPDPEERLVGSQYTCYGDISHQTDLVVTNPGFWAFAGTGAKVGSRYPGLIGHEIDKAGSSSPANVHIAAHSDYQCRTGSGYFTDVSDLTYYVAASNAGVVNLGTMGFAYALTPGTGYQAGSVAFAKKVVANLATAASRGPLGSQHRETPNYNVIYPPFDVYTTPGEHLHNGRRWKTSCEPYSQTSRCRTEIWATTVTQVGGRFQQVNGWAFNNLTYLPMPRATWRENPLASSGTFTSQGRQWRTECDTAATGRNGCRSYIHADYIESSIASSGNRTFRWVRGWLFNNMVRFS